MKNLSQFKEKVNARELLVQALYEFSFGHNNAKAIEDGYESWETEVDGSLWKQKSFPYQAKCYTWIKDEFNSLNDADKKRVSDSGSAPR